MDESFIESFSNKEITDLCCDVEIEASRDGAWGEILCKIVGHLTVPCDRCLEPIDLPLDIEENFTLRFDATPQEVDDDNDNMLVVDAAAVDFDMGQTVYDFIALSIPLQRVHKDNGCNPQMLAHITTEQAQTSSGNSPFSGLLEMLEKK
ncbi:MAG: DUF177 domain-containing protein [Bacteroidales bacterium]|nr:DUF177 domain-containing protein [Bacteroidales bacterium]